MKEKKKKTSLPCVWEKTRGGKRKYNKQQLRLFFIMLTRSFGLVGMWGKVNAEKGYGVFQQRQKLSSKKRLMNGCGDGFTVQ